MWSSYSTLNSEQRRTLFTSIAHAFRSQGITHIALNAPISLYHKDDGKANDMRSPTGLIPVYGDFGPRGITCEPTPEDFDRAFWVSTVQNSGIVQVWAPLWTMFSRGNIGEKARILGIGDVSVFPGLSDRTDHKEVKRMDVVDFYVGIGYFALSYLRRGVRRVFGWEINAWSVEGLRRGAERNGWDVCIVRVDEEGKVDVQVFKDMVHMLADNWEGRARCLVFHGDNRWAGKIMAKVKKLLEAGGLGDMLSIRHVNLGLLPSSRASWEDAVACIDKQKKSWLHVHENVDVQQFESRAEEVTAEISHMAGKLHGWSSLQVTCCHVEQVKTYAPSVMHCVFDIEILPAR